MYKPIGLVTALSLGLGLAISSAAAQTIQDSTIVDPDVHQVVLDNAHVRVLEARAAPGKKSPMHSHPPLLIVGLSAARVKFTFPDGKSQIFDLRPGGVLWIDGVEHSWELLAGDLHVIGVEVKAAKAATK